MSGLTVVVIGATGQFGRAMMRAVVATPGWHAIGLGHADVDVTDVASVGNALAVPHLICAVCMAAVARRLALTPAVSLETFFCVQSVALG